LGEAIWAKRHLTVHMNGITARQQILTHLDRKERLQEWIEGLEKRISVERRFKVLTALRRELEKCQDDVRELQELIDRLQAGRSGSKVS
jgi:DNA repair ATPase RecN